MKKHILLPILIIAAIVFCGGFELRTDASGDSSGPDAVAGARSSAYSAEATIYDVVAATHSGGTVSPSVSGSGAGRTIHIGIKPNGGYEVASVTVITASGELLELFLDNGAYGFVMPSESVVVDVMFQYIRQ